MMKPVSELIHILLHGKQIMEKGLFLLKDRQFSDFPDEGTESGILPPLPYLPLIKNLQKQNVLKTVLRLGVSRLPLRFRQLPGRDHLEWMNSTVIFELKNSKDMRHQS